MATPPLPPGYQLDQPSSSSALPPLPPGYKLDSPTPAGAPVQAPQGPPPGMLDKEIPLDSTGNAFLSGLQSIGRGTRDAVKGAAAMFAPPETTGEKIASAMPGMLPIYRTARSLAGTAAQATQLPAAASDIYHSQDPLGYTAKALQETAGQGAGQALTALATEGAMRGAPKVVEAARNITPKQIAQGVGGAGGGIAGHGTLSAPGAYYGGKTGGALAESVLGKVRANTPIFGARAAAETATDAGEATPHFQKAPAPNPSVEADTDPVLSDQSVLVGKTPKAGQRPDGPYSGPRTPVMESANSGHLQKIGYHADSQTAVIEYPNGKVYEYRGVPQEVFDNMKNAESQGSFAAQNLKGRYETNYRGAVKPLTAGAKAKQALLNQSSSLGGQQ